MIRKKGSGFSEKSELLADRVRLVSGLSLTSGAVREYQWEGPAAFEIRI
jgi:hypothetical protein